MLESSQRIEPLNDAERAWVRDELINARRLVQLHCAEDYNASLTPDILDRAYSAAYCAAPTADADYANAIINAIGIAFGQYLVDTLGFQWCAVFDSQGQELAIVALPETAKVLVFPPNLVAKRWESGATGFLGTVYIGIKDQLEAFRKGWDGQDKSVQLMSSARGGFLGWFRRLFSQATHN